jgi:hypothetical protein
MPPQQSNLSIKCVVKRNQHALPLPPSSIAPTVGDTHSNADRSNLNPPAPQPLEDGDEYKRLDWRRVLFLERCQLEHNARGKNQAGYTTTDGPYGIGKYRRITGSANCATICGSQILILMPQALVTQATTLQRQFGGTLLCLTDLYKYTAKRAIYLMQLRAYRL